MKSSEYKTLSRKKIFIFISIILIIAALAGEVILRLIGYAPVDTEYVWVQGDIGIHKPYWKGLHNSKLLMTNRWGLRGDDFPIEKPSGEYRVLCLGDSVTFGCGVANGEDYPAQLGYLLNKHPVGFSHYQIINTGVCGNGANREVEYYKRIGASFNPDKIILGICLNDVTEKNVPLPVPGKNILRNIAYYKFFQSIYRRQIVKDIRDDKLRYYGLRDDVTKNNISAETEKCWEVVFTELRRLKEAMGPRANSDLLIILFPVESQLTSGETGPQHQVNEFCKKENLQFADALPVLQGTKERMFLDELHLNPSGCRRIAEWLTGIITNQENK